MVINPGTLSMFNSTIGSISHFNSSDANFPTFPAALFPDRVNCDIWYTGERALVEPHDCWAAMLMQSNLLSGSRSRIGSTVMI